MVLTFFSESTSSVLDFFSYPGGGKGKQRDISQKFRTQKTSAFEKPKHLNYLSVAMFQKRNNQ